jgi:hypothetical protein
MNFEYVIAIMDSHIFRIKQLLLLVVLIIINALHGNYLFSQSREILVKAGYIEKFTHFVQWPEDTSNSDIQDKLVIAIIGENTIGDALSAIFSKSRDVRKEVKIIHLTSVDQIVNCMILFISGSEKENIDKILKYTTGKPILTISDSKGFCEKGVIINMFQDENYIHYQINRASLNKSGLIINSILLNYAVII